MEKQTPVVMNVPQFVQQQEEQDPNQSLRNQRDGMLILLAMPVRDSIGVCCSYLLHAALSHPALLRRVMNEQVVREGFVGTSLLETIKRACR